MTNSFALDSDRAVRDGYERVLRVFRAVDAIAAAQCKLSMHVYRGGP